MSRSPFQDRLQAGSRLLGTLVQIPHPEVAVQIGRQGFDWLFLDGEHGGFGPEEVTKTLTALAGTTPCLVRVPTQDEAVIEAMMACGPTGIIVPHVDSAAQAVAMVKQVGGRGLVVIQAESREAVAHIRDIVQVPGVDAVLVGPYDLTASLGIPEQFDHPAFREALGAIVEACQGAHMPLGIFRMTPAEVFPHEGQGFTLLVVGLDGRLLEMGARGLLSELRKGPYSGQ